MIAISGTSRCSLTCPTNCMGEGRFHTDVTDEEVAALVESFASPPPLFYTRKGKARTGLCAPLGRSAPPAKAATARPRGVVKLEERCRWV